MNQGVQWRWRHRSNPYASGKFTTAVAPANYIAKWDGSNWSALGSGLYGAEPYTSVYALAVSGSTSTRGASSQQRRTPGQ
jgi:hypothetical protein